MQTVLPRMRKDFQSEGDLQLKSTAARLKKDLSFAIPNPNPPPRVDLLGRQVRRRPVQSTVRSVQQGHGGVPVAVEFLGALTAGTPRRALG